MLLMFVICAFYIKSVYFPLRNTTFLQLTVVLIDTYLANMLTKQIYTGEKNQKRNNLTLFFGQTQNN